MSSGPGLKRPWGRRRTGRPSDASHVSVSKADGSNRLSRISQQEFWITTLRYTKYLSVFRMVRLDSLGFGHQVPTEAASIPASSETAVIQVSDAPMSLGRTMQPRACPILSTYLLHFTSRHGGSHVAALQTKRPWDIWKDPPRSPVSYM